MVVANENVDYLREYKKTFLDVFECCWEKTPTHCLYIVTKWNESGSWSWSGNCETFYIKQWRNIFLTLRYCLTHLFHCFVYLRYTFTPHCIIVRLNKHIWNPTNQKQAWANTTIDKQDLITSGSVNGVLCILMYMQDNVNVIPDEGYIRLSGFLSEIKTNQTSIHLVHCSFQECFDYIHWSLLDLTHAYLLFVNTI